MIDSSKVWSEQRKVEQVWAGQEQIGRTHRISSLTRIVFISRWRWSRSRHDEGAEGRIYTIRAKKS